MIARLLVFLVRLWQIGPSRVLPPSCRYDPSCSAYAIEALRRYGAAKGGVARGEADRALPSLGRARS